MNGPEGRIAVIRRSPLYRSAPARRDHAACRRVGHPAFAAGRKEPRAETPTYQPRPCPTVLPSGRGLRDI